MAFKSLTGFDFSNQNGINVADPSANTHVANKQYVDSVARGLRWKESVRAASTANGALATAFENGDTLDGVVLATGDRILLKDQTTQTENGIYIVAATGAPTRALDLASGSDAKGIAVTVTNGTVNNDRVYIQTEDPAVVGTNNLTFSQLGGGGTTYTAGAGLTESPAGTFNVANTDGALTVGANSVDLASQVAGAGLTLSSGVLNVVGDASITVAADQIGLASGVAGTGLTLTTGVLSVNTSAGVTTSGDNVVLDTTVAVRKFAADIGNGTNTSYTVTHNLGTKDITWSIRTNADDSFVVADVVATSTTQATVTFAAAPSSNQYRIIIHG